MSQGNGISHRSVQSSEVVSASVETARYSLDDDLPIVERFLSGDEASFEVLYRRYYDRVFSIAKGILVDQEEAADAVQEVFTLVYRHLPRFDRRARFSTWIFRIAVNRSIQESRKARFRHRHVELHEAASQVAPAEAESADPKVQTALTQLSPTDRALIVLFYWEELSLQEIAESLGCRVNAAKTRLYRARERFRTIYEGLQG